MSQVESLRGQLLIASPALFDPNFRRTVVLVTEHNDEGAMGLVLNRPSETAVADGAPPLQRLVEDGALVHVGGPVEPAAVTVLAEFEDPDDAAVLVLEDIGFVHADAELEDLPGATKRARVFAGYCGWLAGQLEAELEGDDSWIVATPLPDDIFADESEDVWGDVLRRKGGQFAIVALMPFDPSVN
jgi:putative transcriptional regulator